MARVMLALIIVAALVGGCEYLPLFRVSDVFPAWRSIPEIETLDDGGAMQLHDFENGSDCHGR